MTDKASLTETGTTPEDERRGAAAAGQLSPDVVATIGLQLLLLHHESAGPHGRIRYIPRHDESVEQ